VTRRLLVAGWCTVVALLGGCGHGGTGDKTTAPKSDPERAIALAAAHSRQQTVHGTFLVATYQPDAGAIAPTNTGHRCRRGHTLLVRLLWKDDASFVHGASTGDPPDGPHKALLLTVNVPSGEICLVGASYAHDDPKQGEIYLYGPRKDLVPR
jgi:hypothetical protein